MLCSYIRTALKTKILKRYLKDPDAVIIDELGINNGNSRIEIKSDSDSLARLPDQIRSFCSVLDRITLVVGYKLAGAALKMVPGWWGVKLAEQKPTGNVHLAYLHVDTVFSGRLDFAILLHQLRKSMH
jgi:hypothetical protein